MVTTQTLTRIATPQERAHQRRQKVLGTQLRTLYASVAGEQTPDLFLQLLNQADQRQR